MHHREGNANQQEFVVSIFLQNDYAYVATWFFRHHLAT